MCREGCMEKVELMWRVEKFIKIKLRILAAHMSTCNHMVTIYQDRLTMRIHTYLYCEIHANFIEKMSIVMD